jgi:DNA-binding LacI/PurR family transcriptional regulator
MRPIRRISLPEQVAANLREGMQDGRWGGAFPGENQLAAELDVSRNTVRKALEILEKEGVLGGRGHGRSRAITTAGAAMAMQRPLRVAILRHDGIGEDDPQSSLIIAEIKHSLEAAGYRAFECVKAQKELNFNVSRISKHLITAGADAWIVVAGSRQLLEWCASQETPCLALYGRTEGLSIARTGPDTVEAYRDATRKLITLGHKRIVLIVREGFRKPPLGGCELAFMNELKSHGIPTSSYNLPDWEESPEGFNRLMESLFKTTPPTAMIIDEVCWYSAALAFLLRRGIRVPEQVSLVSGDCEPLLDMCYPRFAHMRWDNRLIVRRIVRWVDAVRKVKADRHAINIPAEFVSGGSIGPV